MNRKARQTRLPKSITAMLHPINIFSENGLVLELANVFTEKDAELVNNKFEEQLNKDGRQVNLLVKVENGAVISLMKFKAFLEGALWGFRYFDKICRCAIVAHLDLIHSLAEIESKILNLKEAGFEERYFEQDQMDEALNFLKS